MTTVDVTSPEAIAFAEANGIDLPTQEEYEARLQAFNDGTDPETLRRVARSNAGSLVSQATQALIQWQQEAGLFVSSSGAEGAWDSAALDALGAPDGLISQAAWAYNALDPDQLDPGIVQDHQAMTLQVVAADRLDRKISEAMA